MSDRPESSASSVVARKASGGTRRDAAQRPDSNRRRYTDVCLKAVSKLSATASSRSSSPSWFSRCGCRTAPALNRSRHSGRYFSVTSSASSLSAFTGQPSSHAPFGEAGNGCGLWSNLHLLFWLSLLPFATGFMGENHFARCRCALRCRPPDDGRGVFHPGPHPARVPRSRLRLRGAHRRGLEGQIPLIVYVVAIGTRFVQPWISMAIYVSHGGDLVYSRLPLRADARRALKKPACFARLQALQRKPA